MDTCEFECRICQARGPHEVYHARELMHGTRDKFDYIECTSCKTVQIVDMPVDGALARYYPRHYYSYSPQRRNKLARWLIAQRDRHVLGLSNIGGAVIGRFKMDPVIQVLARANLKPTQRILDVGCGAGRLLDRLTRAGCRDLVGIDPFMPRDLRTPAGVPIKKQRLDQVSGTFDVVMFNHSLEHVVDPVSTLKDANARLAAHGAILVRIPTPSSDAWQIYRADWVQLDPPRHIVLPSREGMAIMARRAGLTVERVIDDSGAFQFVGSEKYRRDMPLHSPESDTLFAADEIARFAKRADDLNALHRGDQALFILRKMP